MKKLLIPFLILTNTLFSQDTIKTKFTFDLTGSVSQANDNKQDNILLNSFSSVGWKKFETGLSTSYQMMTNNNTQLINDFVLRVQPRVIDDKYSIFSFGQISSLYSKKVNQRVEAGVGYGSYARVLLSPLLEQLESRSTTEPQRDSFQRQETFIEGSQPLSQKKTLSSVETRPSLSVLEANPELLWQVVGKASTLVSQIKSVIGDH